MLIYIYNDDFRTLPGILYVQCLPSSCLLDLFDIVARARLLMAKVVLGCTMYSAGQIHTARY